jgi:hypothetical protein
MVEAGDREPVALQLFREAWELKRSNPRSALAIGIAAAEIGVKDLIASLIPNALWLVTPSPAGAPLPDWKELDSILRAVNDVLWVCELYTGADE